MTTPNFLVIGAPKAATTTLCALLEQHPEVYMFPRKASQFFNRRYDFGWPWYQSLFAKAEGHKAIGEGSPGYTGTDGTAEVAERIHRHIPGVRLIYMVRHPLRRLESHYAQMIDNGRRFESFSHAVRTCPPLLAASRYWARLSDYRKYFGDDQLLVLFSEDLREDPARALRQCYEFLRIDPEFQVHDDDMERNTRSDKRIDGLLLRLIRRNPAYVKLQWALPKRLTERLKPWLRRRVRVDVTWDQETRQVAVERLRDDSAQFLEHCGRPAGFWNLEE